MNWLRRFIRKNTTPIPVEKAIFWKKRLSVAYMLLTWNAFGLVCYMIYTGKGDWAKYYGVKSEEESNMNSGLWLYFFTLNGKSEKNSRISLYSTFYPSFTQNRMKIS